MPEKTNLNLSDVAETLLIPLYIRAIETQRPDALIKDERAVELVRQLDFDFSKILAKIDEEVQVTVILRTMKFDRYAQEFIGRSPEAVIVHIGCGLDSRFERVDNDQVEWYDLDLPEVIELRKKLINTEETRYHLLPCSILDRAWLTTVAPQSNSVHRPPSFLFLAEGVLMYFDEAQVKSLLLLLKENFPGAELVFDAFSPFYVWANNRRVTRTKIGARCQWSLKHGTDLESWGEGIRLLDEWFPFCCPEPRLSRIRWVRHIPLLSKTTGVYHYRLG